MRHYKQLLVIYSIWNLEFIISWTEILYVLEQNNEMIPKKHLHNLLLQFPLFMFESTPIYTHTLLSGFNSPEPSRDISVSLRVNT